MLPLDIPPNSTSLATLCFHNGLRPIYQKKLIRPEIQATFSPALRHLLALDDPTNDELAKSTIARSGFLPERPRAD